MAQVLDSIRAVARRTPATTWITTRIGLHLLDDPSARRALTGSLIPVARRLGIIVAQPCGGAPLRIWHDAGIPVAYGSDKLRNPFYKLADLAVLSQDIFTIPGRALPGTTSVLTMVGGRVAYDAMTPK